MFLLNLFGKTKPYSCLANAEREAAIWLNKHTLPNYWLGLDGAGSTPKFRKDFEDAMRREDYTTCVKVWNKYIVEHYYGESVRMVVINEVKVDSPFSDVV